MKKTHGFQKGENKFTLSAAIIVCCLIINLNLSQAILYFEIPLFLDSIGTILAAALGGYLPGIVVGFLTNVINGISDPITLYYSLVSILIGTTAAYMTKKYVYARFTTAMLTSIPYAIIGGGLGSVLTWMLYGFNFGTGISAPFAVILNEGFKISKFWAQFIADMGIDFADKIISVIAVFAILKLLFKTHTGRVSNAKYFSIPPKNEQKKDFIVNNQACKHSLQSKIVGIIVCASVALCSASVTISFWIYRETMTNQYIKSCNSIVEMMRKTIEADKVNEYLTNGKDELSYVDAKNQLIQIKDSFEFVEYLYVYQIKEDGCHVVFDLDTPELLGEPLGSVVPFDESFADYRNQLLRGEDIEPLITNDSYGWLLTVYKPIADSNGKCVAYAAADINMESVIAEQYIFIIKMISLLFGMTIIIIFCASRFAGKKIISPINAMTQAAGQFAYGTESDRKKTTENIEALRISTGDEIENLYHSINKTVSDFNRYITLLSENANTISNLHRGMILSFASIVESRDLNTGEHIRRTAAYVKAIALELRNAGKYTEILTDDYIERLEENAPLHDIGKAGIADRILNKPGKLTSDEFEQMKLHTLIGKQFLIDASKNINDEDYLREAINMACYHHEHWDSTGYPKGLCGQEIPLSARIMAVADVFDALVSKRSYKEALSFEKAISIIKDESGSHFDPDIVQAFIQIQPQIIAIMNNTKK